jgi:acetyl esterase/lipase
MKTLFLLPALFGVAVLVLSGCSTHRGHVGAETPEPLSLEYRVLRDQAYSPDGWPERLAGDLYIPDGKGPFPGVLIVHGGGWEGRSRSDMAFIARRLARRGFVAFNISHRFAPDYAFPAQLHDLQLALRWMREQAMDIRLDPERVGGFGYSSGGHLVALLGLLDGTDALDSPHGGPGSRLQAVVAGGMPSDLRSFPDGRLVRQFLGGPLKAMPATYAQASPIAHVDADDPPVFLYHAGWDQLVQPEQARRMHEKLKQTGVPTELFIVNGLGHATLFLFNRSAVRKGIDFLARVLKPS